MHYISDENYMIDCTLYHLQTIQHMMITVAAQANIKDLYCLN